MQPLEILHQVWQHSWGTYIFLPTKEGDIWHENPAVAVYGLDELPQPPGHDIYFTPARYTAPERSLDATGPLGVLYADLDGDYDRAALLSIPPSLWWETSPGNEQAIWYVAMDNAEYVINTVNRKLSRYLLADHGSWIPTKLLRVPESINYKRGGVKGVLLDHRPDRYYYVTELDEWLPELTATPYVLGTAHPEVPDHKQWRALVEKWWDKFDHRTKQMLLAAEVPDRSLHLARLAKRMAAISVPPQEIFGILHNLSTNKFHNRPEVLWNSVVLTADVDIK